MISVRSHGFWVMLVFAVSLAVLKAVGGDALSRLQANFGDVLVAVLLIVPAWFWLQFIARTLKVVCVRCGKRTMGFTGQFPLRRTFHCDACGKDYEIPRPGAG